MTTIYSCQANYDVPKCTHTHGQTQLQYFSIIPQKRLYGFSLFANGLLPTTNTIWRTKKCTDTDEDLLSSSIIPRILQGKISFLMQGMT